ncbi:MAG: argininosuccinate synthase [Deltaproteobacteria bacterium]|nr:argininosuccinate synthase [Deltaproteobacteria bacterium]
MSKETVVLAYSGGLDTSIILKWLVLEGYRVVAFVADVGQEEDFDEVRRRAIATGADAVHVVDLKREFVTDFIFPAVAGNAVYEGRYLLGTALARPIIAKAHVAVARQENAQLVSHGATGKGNDQVRFELGFAALAPDLKVFAPWKEKAFLDRFAGRKDLIAFAEEQGIEIPVTLEKPFSTDENLMHKSYESGILDDPSARPGKEIFTVCLDPTDAPDAVTKIDVEFRNAIPVRVKNLEDGREETEPLALFEFCNELGRKNGVGRIDIVENRYVGIKSRGIYETPGGTILHRALRDLEGIAMDQVVRRLRDMLAPEYADIIYNGYWFSPEMDFLSAALKKSQELIDGVVTLELYKGNCMPVGRTSPSSLYDENLSSMDIHGGFDQQDSKGFIAINALRLKAHRLIVKSRG